MDKIKVDNKGAPPRAVKIAVSAGGTLRAV